MSNAPRPSRVAHAGITVSSEERATELFGGLFGLAVVKTFDVRLELTRALFDMDAEARAVVYAGGEGAELEVFVCPERVARRETYDHLCVAVADRERLLGRAESLGMEVRRFRKGDKEVVFLRDLDGNLYEIKSTEPE